MDTLRLDSRRDDVRQSISEEAIMQDNPYRPPLYPDAHGAITRYGHFVPLGSRMTWASIAIVLSILGSFTLDAVQLTFGHRLDDPPEAIAAVALVLATVASIGSYLLAAVFYCIWLHRAASNVHALGRRMTVSPGWCVGWFFVPIASLVKPYRAVSELWSASDPDYGEHRGWRTPTGASMLPWWWGAWIASTMIQNASGRIDDSSTAGSVGLLGTFAMALAAFGCISVMRDITTRQEQSASRPS